SDRSLSVNFSELFQPKSSVTRIESCLRSQRHGYDKRSRAKGNTESGRGR
ncbi:hypothetical protein LINPERHAP2_LOCUS28933, partial [Linum perenne]